MFNRREILAAGAAAGAVLVSGRLKGRGRWEFFSEDEAATLAALADQIIPADDFPSASDAGAVVYIDRQLTGPYRRHRSAYRRGLAAAADLVRARFGLALSRATPAQQLEIARAVASQNPAFFDLLRQHTMQGYYGSPRHGGNRDAISWRMLSLDEPPLRGRAQYDLTPGPRP